MLASGLDRRKRALLLSFDGGHCLISEDGIAHKGKFDLPPSLIAASQAHFRSGGSTEEKEWENSKALFSVLDRPRRLFVVGAARIAIHFVRFARVLGYETVVIDPRAAYSHRERFPDPPDTILGHWPEEA